MLQSLIFFSPLSGYPIIDFYLFFSYSDITGIVVPDFTERRNVKGLILLSRHIPDIVRIPVRTELF
nr:MAG TPA: hypothetical protein [Caudoviricetes sp.]